MKKITDKQIEHLADLSALAFTDEEKEKMKTDLEQILKFVDQIENCDAGKINSSNVSMKLSDLREDEAKAGLSQAEATSNAPKTDGKYYVVSKVVD